MVKMRNEKENFELQEEGVVDINLWWWGTVVGSARCWVRANYLSFSL